MRHPLLEAEFYVRTTIDIVGARQQGRELALKIGFTGIQVMLIAAAISEVARNMVDHAQGGSVQISEVQNNSFVGIQVVAKDRGPGIADIDKAMKFGDASRERLGVGLPGAKWLMDDFDVKSTVGEGTVVTMRKWLGRGESKSASLS